VTGKSGEKICRANHERRESLLYRGEATRDYQHSAKRTRLKRCNRYASDKDITLQEPRSVLTNRRLADIAMDRRRSVEGDRCPARCGAHETPNKTSVETSSKNPSKRCRRSADEVACDMSNGGCSTNSGN
jgi:hypothetical protein